MKKKKGTHNGLLSLILFCHCVWHRGRERRANAKFDKDSGRCGSVKNKGNKGDSYLRAIKKDKKNTASHWDSCSKWNTCRLHVASHLQGYSILIRVLETSFIRLSLISPTHPHLKHTHTQNLFCKYTATREKKKEEKKDMDCQFVWYTHYQCAMNWGQNHCPISFWRKNHYLYFLIAFSLGQRW